MSRDYKKVDTAVYQRRGGEKTAETRYWKKFRQPFEKLEPSAVTHVEFRKCEPFDLLYTASTRLQALSGNDLEVKGTFSRFKETAYSGSFKPDGRTVAAGVGNGDVKVFNYDSRKLLRLLKGHSQAVQVVRYGLSDPILLSGSDDKTVRIWDIGTGEEVSCFSDAKDYVRTLAPLHGSSMFAAGSLDGIVRLYDPRQQECAFELKCGEPVSGIVALPGGAMIATSSGSEVKMWDIVSGGKVTKSMRNHQKPVSCLTMDGSGNRLLSAGLDRMIKVIDMNTLRVSHTIRTEEAPLSVAMAPDNGRFAYGTTQGRMVVKSMRGWTVSGIDETELGDSSDDDEGGIAWGGDGKEARTGSGGTRNQVASIFGAAAAERQKILHGGTRKHWMRGQNARAGNESIVIASTLKAALKPFDTALKRFEYKDALLSSLKTRQPPIVCAVLEELAQRGGLTVALSNHTEPDMEAIMSFLQKYISHPQYASLLIDVSGCMLEIYANQVGTSVSVDEMFFRLRNRVQEEVALQKRLLSFKGALQAILTTASLARPNTQ
mmetsp:Transcript_37673/g.97190  ORF Transcript_37673/g.97190 Transcript_37673/m.97190 type:complete len:546 (-) Transcript_37673:794-2431(-)|eukprot:CAMPEP_0113876170 /NCGR_PEP_ID=MMETSP0780_2-20120614/5340_1 /TAXON_ID=652834 /ORGANISM="Palpitomonas bilix" /LENGTH=545 /DNA_ID=CAMNT_0000862223 /DNA_START=18 /DNA_END=1655 /DNA_ORIENTATION=+ /assembly_acc=CAM_ASM_000599